FRVYQTKAAFPQTAPLFVFHHGGGHTALTWALVADGLRRLLPDGCSVLCFDCRGHGTCQLDNANLSLERLSADLVALIDALYPEKPAEIFLIGHSMGGAVVVDAAQTMKGLTGVAVLDVVEGTAMDSLIHMRSILRSRPKSFASIPDAIAWSVRSMSVKDNASARVSIPSQIKLVHDADGAGARYEWITDLSASEQHWEGWFKNLSSKFLTMRCARLLILAGTDRLDTALTIGQMQGK
ncbi:Alpha/Beta hydrolase protein, partial [Blyttiomyces helicus]